MRHSNKLEFSKKITLFAGIAALLVIIGAYALMWHTGDLSELGTIISGTFAVIMVIVGFYFNKAKAENKIKIAKENAAAGIPATEESGEITQKEMDFYLHDNDESEER